MKAKICPPGTGERGRSSSACAGSKGRSKAIEKMVEADTDCSDVLMQVVSARRALKSFSEEMIESRLHEYIENTSNQSEGRRELNSLLTVLKRYAV